MRIEYDKQSHGMFIRLVERKIHESEEVTPGIVVDFDADGQPVGIELEDVRGFVSERSIRALTEPRIRSGSDLRKFRTSLGMTQDELADALEVTANTVARWERGEVGMQNRVIELALAALVSHPEK